MYLTEDLSKYIIGINIESEWLGSKSGSNTRQHFNFSLTNDKKHYDFKKREGNMTLNMTHNP